jgi:hypothetical protein
MSIDPTTIQIAFYIFSPVVALLAVGTAYLAIYRQSKPNVIVHYEPSNDAGSVIDLVISNYGGGTATNVEFSDAIPINCWGIDKPHAIDKEKFLSIHIPLLAPGKALRYQAGQYGGLLSQVGETFNITATYSYRTPLRRKKPGKDTSMLDVKYMATMHAGNSAAYDLADAMKGRNNTIFLKTNKELESIGKSLSQIVSLLEKHKDSGDEMPNKEINQGRS